MFTPMFIAAVFVDSQNLATTQISMNGQMDKLWYIHTMEYESATKRNEILTHATV